MKTEIIKVNKVDIECPFENETHYVAIRSICQALGIDHKSQFEKIKKDEFLSKLYSDHCTVADKNGAQRKMFCLPLKYFFGWLFSIDESKVSERARSSFKKYKRECYDVLYDHFYLRGAMYEKRERIKLAKKNEILEATIAKNNETERIKRLKAELQEIEDSPINQLTFNFNEPKALS